jgi:hypothetical protein
MQLTLILFALPSNPNKKAPDREPWSGALVTRSRRGGSQGLGGTASNTAEVWTRGGEPAVKGRGRSAFACPLPLMTLFSPPMVDAAARAGRACADDVEPFGLGGLYNMATARGCGSLCNGWQSPTVVVDLQPTGIKPIRSSSWLQGAKRGTSLRHIAPP